MGAGCLSRRAHARNRLSFGWLEGGWFCRALARAPAIPNAAANAAAHCAHCAAHIALRKSSRAPAKQLEAPARVLEHRACGLSAHWGGVLRWSGGDVLPGRVSAHDAVKFRCSRDRGTANWRGNLGFRWIGQAFAVPRLRDVDCDGVARRRPSNRGIFRTVFYLLLRDRAAPNSARRGWRDHSGLRVLLVSESCPRDVLASGCQGPQSSLARIARDTGANHVLPDGESASVARHDVIEIQVVPLKELAAVLAGVLIALKYIVPRKFHFLFRQPIEEEQHDHTRHPNLPRNRGDDFVIGRGGGKIAPTVEVMREEIEIGRAHV